MRRLGFILFIAVLLAGTASAQDRTDRQERNNRRNGNEFPDRNNRQRTANSVTVDGTLRLENGFVAVASGDSVYYVPMLERYIGFIDGLKEGTNVSVEGIEAGNFIRPTKVTIDGKSYDFFARGNGFERGPGFMMGDRFSPGSGPSRGRNMQGPNRRQGFGRGGSCCW